MSTQPIGRRRLKPVGPRMERGKVLSAAALFAAVFVAAFIVAHTRGTAGSLTERLPPSLPRVATPIPAALAAAPPIELAVRQPPPRPKPPAPEPKAATPAAEPSVAPVVAAPAPVQSTPVQTTAPPPAPASPPPTTPSKGGSGSGGSGGGSGTSFESSG